MIFLANPTKLRDITHIRVTCEKAGLAPRDADNEESFSTQRHGGKPKEGNPRIQRIGRERSVALRIKSGKKPRLELQVKIVKYLLFLLGEPRKFNEIIGIKSNLSN